MLTIHSSLVLTERRTMVQGLVNISRPPSDHIRLKKKFKRKKKLILTSLDIYEVKLRTIEEVGKGLVKNKISICMSLLHFNFIK